MNKLKKKLKKKKKEVESKEQGSKFKHNISIIASKVSTDIPNKRQEIHLKCKDIEWLKVKRRKRYHANTNQKKAI